MKTLALALVLAALTACGSTTPSSTPAPTTTTSTTTITSTPPSTTSATTAPTTTTPTTSAGPPLAGQPLTALDGKNYATCRDGNCQVLVNVGSRLRVATSNGQATIRVTAVGDDGISLSIVGDSGFSTATSSGPTQGEFVRYNNVKFEALAVQGESGVLRLVTV